MWVLLEIGPNRQCAWRPHVRRPPEALTSALSDLSGSVGTSEIRSHLIFVLRFLLFPSYHYHRIPEMSPAHPGSRPRTRSQVRVEAEPSAIAEGDVNTPATDSSASISGAAAPRKRKKSTRSSKAPARTGATGPMTRAARKNSSNVSAQIMFPPGMTAIEFPAAPVDSSGATVLDASAPGSSAAKTNACPTQLTRPRAKSVEASSTSSTIPSVTYQTRNPRDAVARGDFDGVPQPPRADELRRSALGNFRATTPAATVESDPFPATPPPRTRTASDAHELNKQVNSTPLAHTARTGNRDSDDAEDIEQQLLKEVQPIYVTDGKYIKTLYPKVATTKAINEFLDAPNSPFQRTRPGSKGGRWKGIPEVADREAYIYSPMAKAIETVRKAFHSKVPAIPGVSRKVIDTHDSNLYHLNHLLTRPDLVVRAEGPSFELPSKTSQSFQGMDALGYTNVAAVFELKREESKGTDEENVGQLGRYCQ